MTAGKKAYTLKSETLQEIRAARERKGLTQEQLAEKFGRTRVTYNRLENGQMNVITQTLKEVCEELDLEPHVILTRKGEGPVQVKEMMAELEERKAEIEQLKVRVAALERENEMLLFQNELLKENRRLRGGGAEDAKQ